MSLALSSGNSSNTASARRTSNGSGVCARHGSVAPSVITTHKSLVCFVMILVDCDTQSSGSWEGRRKRAAVEGTKALLLAIYHADRISLFEQLNLSRIQ